MAERTIKIKSFVWHKKGKDYNGDDIVSVVQSSRGEVVDLPDNVIAYGEAHGAFITPEDEAVEEAATADVSLMGEDELVDWVSEHTIPEIVNVAKTDPDLVGPLLAAENTATGNDPRSGLVEGLAHVAGSGEAPQENPPSEDEVPTTDDGTTPAEPETVDDLAARLGVDVAEVTGTGDEDAVTVDDVKNYYDEEMANATDGAVALAEDQNVFLADITGSGDEGRISKDDVQAYLDAQAAETTTE
jgi:pyruvate/2-oxoglutarate dehydrogenase complex dihydrolipoamide acyltransferase (E2) component